MDVSPVRTARLLKSYLISRISYSFEQRANTTLDITSLIYGTGLAALGWILVAKGIGSSKISDILLYYVVGLVMYLFTNPRLAIASIVMKAIASGEINSILIKPIHAMQHYWLLQQTKVPLRQLIVIIFYVTLLLTILPFTFMKIGVAIYFLACALLISFSINTLVATIGFYVVESTGIRNAFVITVGLLQGSQIPLFLYPSGILTLLSYTPLPYAFYWPVQALTGETLPIYLWIYAGIWAIVLPIITLKIFNRCLRNYEGIGI